MFNIPNLDDLYEEVAAYVREHQGEKGYIDCQPYQKEPGDIIYTFEYNEFSGWGEERMVYGVRWNEEERDLEICFEPYVRSYRLVYDEKAFKGEYEGEDKDANAEWYSVRWSDIIYFIPTIFSIAENIEEYA
jgi:hypothetical protein